MIITMTSCVNVLEAIYMIFKKGFIHVHASISNCITKKNNIMFTVPEFDFNFTNSVDSC